MPGASANIDGRTAPDRTVRDKREARARAIESRSALGDASRRAAADAIAAAELPFVSAPARCISAFHPVGPELDVMTLVARLVAEGHKIALPVVVAPRQPLVFRAWAPGDPLEAGVKDIPVPLTGAREVVPDILLVPLLAFDARGYRLGYGGGFYDRTIAALRARAYIVAVGVGFAAQEVSEVPTASYDERLDWLLTEDGAREAAS